MIDSKTDGERERVRVCLCIPASSLFLLNTYDIARYPLIHVVLEYISKFGLGMLLALGPETNSNVPQVEIGVYMTILSYNYFSHNTDLMK